MYLLLKSQMQYRASLFMAAVTHFFQPFALFAGIYFLFERFGSLGGWTMHEVFICYAVMGICYTAATSLGRGFYYFPNEIRTASFDRILVRPRSTILQILGADFDIKRIGYFIQSAVVLFVAVRLVGIEWNAARAVLLFNMLVGGSLIFGGVYMVSAAVSFWTIGAVEIQNILAYGVRQHASYPLDVFPKWIKNFFTFVVPFGTINYIPMQYLVGKTESAGWLHAFVPLAGALFIIPCYIFWRIG